MAAVTLLALAPFAWVANSYAARQSPSRFNPSWTSAVLYFVVKKKSKMDADTEIGQIGWETQAQTQAEAAPAAPLA
jgi:hypothetical protein